MGIRDDVRREGLQAPAVVEAAEDAFSNFFDTADPNVLRAKYSNSFLAARLLVGFTVERYFEWSTSAPQVHYSVGNSAQYSGLLNGGLRKEPTKLYSVGQATPVDERHTKLTNYLLLPSSPNTPAGLHVFRASVVGDLLSEDVGEQELKGIAQSSIPEVKTDSLATMNETEQLVELLAMAGQRAAAAGAVK